MPVEVVYSDQVLSHHRHAHVSYEMLFILEGQAQMQVGGRKWMARGGDLFFLSPFEEHATALVQPPYRRYYALIPPDEMQAMGLEPELLSVFRMHGGDFPYALATGAWQARFEEYFSLLQEATARPGAEQGVRLRALMALILTDARALAPGLFAPAFADTPLPMQQILDTLDRDFAAPFSLEGLARAFHVSPGCLSSHFRRSVGMSPMQYVMNTRLTHAKALLLKTALPVGEIALRCGFQDGSNFSRRFRQQFQLSPLSYRRQFRSAPET